MFLLYFAHSKTWMPLSPICKIESKCKVTYMVSGIAASGTVDADFSLIVNSDPALVLIPVKAEPRFFFTIKGNYKFVIVEFIRCNV